MIKSPLQRSQYLCGEYNKTFKFIEDLSQYPLKLNFHSEEFEESMGFEIVARPKPGKFYLILLSNSPEIDSLIYL